MKASPRNLLIALGLFAGFAVAYHWYGPGDKVVVTTEQARRLPAIIPPQPKVDEEERRKREEHQERLIEIYNQEIRELNARRTMVPGDIPLTPGAGAFNYPPARLEPAKPDPARPLEPLERKTGQH